MKIGVCTELDNLEAAQRISFDYVEVCVTAVARLSEAEFEQKAAAVHAAKIGCECFNVLLPGNMVLLGDKATDLDKITEYLHRAFNRLRALGGKIVVLGSGRCRSFPDGMSFFDACRQLAVVVSKIGAIAGEYGLCIAVEPLNHLETNMIRTVTEGAMLVAQVNLPNVRLLADGYHMFTDSEPMDNISRVGDIVHAHIATRDGRRYPLEQDEKITEFFKCLNSIGYNGRVSIEGGTDDFERDAPVSLALLRRLCMNH